MRYDKLGRRIVGNMDWRPEREPVCAVCGKKIPVTESYVWVKSKKKAYHWECAPAQWALRGSMKNG